jgi:hypothetical protein
MVGGKGLNHKYGLYHIIPGVYTPGYGILPLPGFPIMDEAWCIMGHYDGFMRHYRGTGNYSMVFRNVVPWNLDASRIDIAFAT